MPMIPGSAKHCCFSTGGLELSARLAGTVGIASDEPAARQAMSCCSLAPFNISANSRRARESWESPGDSRRAQESPGAPRKA
jgi:hypothetical protein